MKAGVDSDPRWAAWRRAEAALAAPAELDAAVAGLPLRQGRMLRLMAALEEGHRAALERLARELLEAGEKDLFCLARLCLLEPDEIDPSEIRRRAKNLGVPNGPGLPRLDLVRLFAVAMSRGKPTRPPTLSALRYTHPALDALLPLLSSRFTLYDGKDELHRLSPRLSAYWMAAVGCATGRPDVRAFLREELPDAAHLLGEQDWPDLGRDERRTPLERWLETSPAPPWTALLGRHASLLAREGPRPERRRVLGALLVRIDAILREGTPREASGPVEAARQLAESLDSAGKPSSLTLQLSDLARRVDWWSGTERTRSLELLLALWRELRVAGFAERAHFAESTLLSSSDLGGDLPQPLRGELLATFVASRPDLENEGAALLEARGRSIPRKTLERAVAGLADAPSREYLLGFHELVTHDEAAALYRAARLFELPGGEERASRLALDVLSLAFEPGERPPRRQRRALEHLLHALEERTPSIELAALLPLVLLAALGPREFAPSLARLAPALHRAIALPRGPGESGVGDELLLLAIIGEEELGRARLLEIGRHLRSHRDDPRAWEHALDLATRISSSASPRPPLLQAAIDGLSAFLLHRGPDALLEHARAFCESRRRRGGSPGFWTAFSVWVDEHREALGDDAEWDELAGDGLEEGLPDGMDWSEFPPEDMEGVLEFLLGSMDDEEA